MGLKVDRDTANQIAQRWAQALEADDELPNPTMRGRMYELLGEIPEPSGYLIAGAITCVLAGKHLFVVEQQPTTVAYTAYSVSDGAISLWVSMYPNADRQDLRQWRLSVSEREPITFDNAGWDGFGATWEAKTAETFGRALAAALWDLPERPAA